MQCFGILLHWLLIQFPGAGLEVFAGIARRHGIPETLSAKRKKGGKNALKIRD
jgi:hypothetical protein